MSPRLFAVIPLVFVIVSGAACGNNGRELPGLGITEHPSTQSQPKLPAKYLPVPLVPQATSYSCGAAALMGVLEYWNVYDAPETRLHKPLGTNENDGTESATIAQLAREVYGLRAEIRTQMSLLDLRDALKDGTTVILDIQAWATQTVDWKTDWDDGHYVVLVAMDSEFAYFMDPSAHGAYAYIPLPELLDRWHDFDTRPGYVSRFYNLGVLIHGTQAKRQFPGPLIRIN